MRVIISDWGKGLTMSARHIVATVFDRDTTDKRPVVAEKYCALEYFYGIFPVSSVPIQVVVR